MKKNKPIFILILLLALIFTVYLITNNYTYDNFFLSVRRQDPTLDYNHVNNSIIGLPCDDSVTQFKTIIKDVSNNILNN